MTLPRFDYLAQLHRFREEQPEGLRMNALSRYLMVTGGNVTSLTDELEKAGYVTRAGRSRRPALVPHRADAARQARVRARGRGARALGRRTARPAWTPSTKATQLHALLGHLRLSLTRQLQDDKTR